jgi:3'(2'), 5'-bisphosphate nucleotidase
MYEKELEVALAAVRQACALSLNVRQALVHDDTLTKKDRSPVTVADLGIQAIVSHRLHGAFPADPLMAEEEADALRDSANAELKQKVLDHVARLEPALGESGVMAAIERGHHRGGAAGRFWTMDPIDGTKGFIRKDQYAIALALVEDGQVVLGVLGCPCLPGRTGKGDAATGMLFAARRGQGARVGAIGESALRAAAVSPIREPEACVICQSVETGHTSHGRSARIAARLGVRAPSLHIDSQCKYGVVARGEATLYMRLPSKSAPYEELIWDHAAGAIVVTEAGGRVTDTAGKPLDFSLGRTLKANAGIIATNGLIHDRVIEAVQAVMAEG